MHQGQLWSAALFITLLFFLLSSPWIYASLSLIIPGLMNDRGPTILGMLITSVIFLLIVRYLILPMVL